MQKESQKITDINFLKQILISSKICSFIANTDG